MTLTATGLHHIALICSDITRAKAFYCDVLGLTVLAENYRADRGSWKVDLALPDGGQLELFSFPNPPPRPSRPEACGARHVALTVADLDAALAHLAAHNWPTEAIRVDEFTGARFLFLADPDGLPIELYEPAARTDRP